MQHLRGFKWISNAWWCQWCISKMPHTAPPKELHSNSALYCFTWLSLSIVAATRSGNFQVPSWKFLLEHPLRLDFLPEMSEIQRWLPECKHVWTLQRDLCLSRSCLYLEKARGRITFVKVAILFSNFVIGTLENGPWCHSQVWIPRKIGDGVCATV